MEKSISKSRDRRRNKQKKKKKNDKKRTKKKSKTQSNVIDNYFTPKGSKKKKKRKKKKKKKNKKKKRRRSSSRDKTLEPTMKKRKLNSGESERVSKKISFPPDTSEPTPNTTPPGSNGESRSISTPISLNDVNLVNFRDQSGISGGEGRFELELPSNHLVMIGEDGHVSGRSNMTIPPPPQPQTHKNTTISNIFGNVNLPQNEVIILDEDEDLEIDDNPSTPVSTTTLGRLRRLSEVTESEKSENSENSMLELIVGQLTKEVEEEKEKEEEEEEEEEEYLPFDEKELSQKYADEEEEGVVQEDAVDMESIEGLLVESDEEDELFVMRSPPKKRRLSNPPSFDQDDLINGDPELAEILRDGHTYKKSNRINQKSMISKRRMMRSKQLDEERKKIDAKRKKDEAKREEERRKEEEDRRRKQFQFGRYGNGDVTPHDLYDDEDEDEEDDDEDGNINPTSIQDMTSSQGLLVETTVTAERMSGNFGGSIFDSFEYEEVRNLMTSNALNDPKFAISFGIDVSQFENCYQHLSLMIQPNDVYFIQKERRRRIRSNGSEQPLPPPPPEQHPRYIENKRVYERTFTNFFNVLCYHVNQEYVSRSKEILSLVIGMKLWKPSLDQINRVFRNYGFKILFDEDEDDDDDDNNSSQQQQQQKLHVNTGRRRKKKKKSNSSHDDDDEDEDEEEEQQIHAPTNPRRVLFKTNFECLLDLIGKLMRDYSVQFLTTKKEVHRFFYLMISIISDRRLRYVVSIISVKKLLITLFETYGNNNVNNGSIFRNLKYEHVVRNLCVGSIPLAIGDRFSYVVEVLINHIHTHPIGLAIKKRVLKHLLKRLLSEGMTDFRSHHEISQQQQQQQRRIRRGGNDDDEREYSEIEFCMGEFERLMNSASSKVKSDLTHDQNTMILELRKLYWYIQLFSDVYLQMSPYNSPFPPPPPSNNSIGMKHVSPQKLQQQQQQQSSSSVYQRNTRRILDRIGDEHAKDISRRFGHLDQQLTRTFKKNNSLVAKLKTLICFVQMCWERHWEVLNVLEEEQMGRSKRKMKQQKLGFTQPDSYDGDSQAFEL